MANTPEVSQEAEIAPILPKSRVQAMYDELERAKEMAREEEKSTRGIKRWRIAALTAGLAAAVTGFGIWTFLDFKNRPPDYFGLFSATCNNATLAVNTRWSLVSIGDLNSRIRGKSIDHIDIIVWDVNQGDGGKAVWVKEFKNGDRQVTKDIPLNPANLGSFVSNRLDVGIIDQGYSKAEDDQSWSKASTLRYRAKGKIEINTNKPDCLNES